MTLTEVRPRKDHRGVDLISDVVPFDRLWYGEPNAVGNAVDYAKFRSRSHDAVVRVYEAAGHVIETHEQLPIRPFKVKHISTKLVPADMGRGADLLPMRVDSVDC